MSEILRALIDALIVIAALFFLYKVWSNDHE